MSPSLDAWSPGRLLPISLTSSPASNAKARGFSPAGPSSFYANKVTGAVPSAWIHAAAVTPTEPAVQRGIAARHGTAPPALPAEPDGIAAPERHASLAPDAAAVQAGTAAGL
jgi:hypothetical protein